jgi:YVTN family beta-propeller protein
MIVIKNIAQIVFLILVLASCEKDEGIAPQCVDCSLDSLKIDTSVAEVFIMNEGNFGWNNGSLSLYTPENSVIQNNIFQKANAIVPGDIVQSMEIINDKGYVVVNNSNKIEVVNLNTFEIEQTINGLNSPRFICKVSENIAYVTSLYGNTVYVLDLQTNTVISEIAVNGWTEQLAVVGDLVYVVSPNSNKLFVLDVIQETIIKEIKTTEFPNSIVKDKNDNVWVLSDGGFESEMAELIRINTVTNEIEYSFNFTDILMSPEDLAIDIYGEQLFYNNSSIYTMSIVDVTLPSVALISNSSRNIYGLGVAPNSDLYLSDALDYTQEGFVYRYSVLGNLIDSFKVGIIPGNFCFN